MNLNLAPMMGRFAGWVLFWAALGAVAATIMRNLMGNGDAQFITTILVAAGSIVGAIGGAVHAVLAVVCEREADKSKLANRKAGGDDKAT